MATANDGISRFYASTSYATPIFASGLITPDIVTPVGKSLDISSDTGLVLSGVQGSMDQTFDTLTTILPNTPMPFLAAYNVVGTGTVVLPLTWYPATRVIFEVTGLCTIERPVLAVYTINGVASYTVPAIGTYLMFSIDTNIYQIVQIA